MSAVKKVKQSDSLSQLKNTGTVVVADTGDFENIKKYMPQDATTNPSLILAASKEEKYAKLIDIAVENTKKQFPDIDDKEKLTDIAIDKLLVEFGKNILNFVPGRVSTEVDARLSFDTEKTVQKALEIIEFYKQEGIDKSRVLIKIASTWEGIKAAQILQKEHQVNCNLTLLFSKVQAVACAEAGSFLISPFVGRILDWFKANTKDQSVIDSFVGEKDPGVISVKEIFNYYKKFNYSTIVMGASFRNVEEIKSLAGVDYLTISPSLLAQLQDSQDDVPTVLNAEDAKSLDIERVSYINDESKFRYDLNNDQMATEKLSEGIRKFSADIVTLNELVGSKF
ncbi:probable transaldolase [Hanseniaspora guilliermondii]|uniref:Transaldolase n=1 Tax=Hanseniaspora guilliermondii TaxID=56406 RepID=A0A1L0AV00_9ASCO|nr:probable transaldolase [Hanseniaspora guilliermondii]